MELYELKNLIMDMSLMGAAQMLKMTSPASDNLSQREAYQAFGEGRVKRWVSTGMVGKMRSGPYKIEVHLFTYRTTGSGQIRTDSQIHQIKEPMAKEQLKKWAEGSNPLRIVEIKTKEHTRRGLFQGIQLDGSFIFLWIPGIAPEVKNVENLQMEAIAMITKYGPEQVISIK